ncbi:transcriptional regulator, IclR family [Quadrisphaera granulorum]|uniref:IclR family transcriptional regulator n=1 Tax=Quadrisphaera granulorum TaxID=317664 RepID=A0A316A9H1_9ACTN|nr:IclR family transcriptional regulator [Quadrisphaera granulorum]PWJ54405.1 IclR family transcriptional regulator [Quadrisphaera granulorum]SZE96177.1 transcriptional regulator, IclR family [Quadrisphaera granulorum]
MAGNTGTAGRSVTSRALSLLAAFDEDHRRLALTVLAERAGMPLPTAHRLVSDLVEFGALTRTPSGDYVVGRRLWDIGLLAPVQSGLREVASPHLQDLYGVTRATVHLAVRDGARALYVDRLRGHASLPIVSTVGSRLPLHATGVGKVLLAHAPAAVQEEVFRELPRLTPFTITAPGSLRRQLTLVLRDGFATTAEELGLGACSVAVPVVQRDQVVAALGVVVPSLTRDRPRLVAALQVAAQGISRSLARVPAVVGEAAENSAPPALADGG